MLPGRAGFTGKSRPTYQNEFRGGCKLLENFDCMKGSGGLSLRELLKVLSLSDPRSKRAKEQAEAVRPWYTSLSI
jgi:hypothetical protein